MSIDRVDQTVVTQKPAARGVSMHRPLTALFRVLFAFALLAPVSLLTTLPVSAATTIAPTTTCGSGLGNLGGRGLICEVTVVNTITGSSRTSTATVRECLGSAGAPTDGSGGAGFACTTKTTNLTEPVTAVTQCNNSINGGGGTLRCSVKITNNFVGVSPGETAATVNQCIGSGAGGIVGGNIHCDPIQATTSAAITQCNGSANGLTLTSPVGLTCTVTGTMASALPVTINQCNGSANGGGALVICSANVTSAVIGAGASGGVGSTATLSPTSTLSDSPSNNSTTPLLPLLIFGFAGMGLAVFIVRRRSIRS